MPTENNDGQVLHTTTHNRAKRGSIHVLSPNAEVGRFKKILYIDVLKVSKSVIAKFLKGSLIVIYY